MHGAHTFGYMCVRPHSNKVVDNTWQHAHNAIVGRIRVRPTTRSDNMKFAQCTFDVSTKITKDAPAKTTHVTLTESDIPEFVVADVLIGGNSPRVRMQGQWRDDGIPADVTMTWAEWVTPVRRTRVNGPVTFDTAKSAATGFTDAEKKALAEMLLASMEQT